MNYNTDLQKTPHKTQAFEIGKYLLENGSITSYESFTEIGCTRLSARIFGLRNRGWEITTNYKTQKNRKGRKTTFAEYRRAEMQMLLEDYTIKMNQLGKVTEVLEKQVLQVPNAEKLLAIIGERKMRNEIERLQRALSECESLVRNLQITTEIYNKFIFSDDEMREKFLNFMIENKRKKLSEI